MMSLLRPPRGVAVLGLFVFSVGCSDDPTSGLTPTTQFSSTHVAPVTIDDRFESIADRAPGFAGMYYDSGVLVVRTTGTSLPEATLAAIEAENAGDLFRGVASALARGAVQFLPAAYDFPTLRQWRRDPTLAMTTAPVVRFDIDERANRVEFGVEEAGTAVTLNILRAQLGIPFDAVSVRANTRIRRTLELTDKVRPNIPGGVQVETKWTVGRGGWNSCTMGVNADTDESGMGFITASHCTRLFAEEDFEDWYQNDRNTSSELVGHELKDPTPWTPYQSPCDTARLGPVTINACRYSDAAFVLYDSSGIDHHGTIAQTENLGSNTFDVSYPRFYLNEPPAGALLVGDTVYQMGKNGGWLRGIISETCEDFRIGSSNNYLLCQYGHDNTDTQNGDSGGPVFTWPGTGNNIDLRGLIAGTFDDDSGAGTYFSKWTYVELEFDELLTLDVAYSP